MPRFSPEEYIANERLMPRESSLTEQATWLRLFNGWSEDDQADIVSFVGFMGWELALRKLRAKEGGLRGVLIPLSRGGFKIVIDPYPHALEEETRALWETPEVRFTLAHEIAHTTFYTPGSPPTRPRRQQPFSDPVEELFCDRFAASLLIPPTVAERSISQQTLSKAAEFYGCHTDVVKLSAELNN